MNFHEYDAISPVDGRYRKQSEQLANYFSEASLIRYRIKVEVAYLIALIRLPLPGLEAISNDVVTTLRTIADNPNDTDIKAVKDIEKETNHDVKAVEYYLRKRLGIHLGTAIEFIHFGLTSQDINNTAVPLSLMDAMNKVMSPALQQLNEKLTTLAETWRFIPLLSHTHGQPASPTTLGKEMAVFVDRMNGQLQLLFTIPWSAKFGGATGNFNAHYAAYPNVNWSAFADEFISELGLNRSQVTTQIEHYDNLAALFDNLKRINTILIDLCRDMWMYISMNYFTQEIKKGEVGSSAMPHKVNPIDFENAEGNFGMANAIFEHLSSKLPVSRLQRDLTDSTVLRNVGVPLAHMLIAINSLMKGLGKVKVNSQAIEDDLEENWAVVSEAIQTILRREGYPHPYDALKQLTRTGEKITRETLHDFIMKLEVSAEVKNEMMKISPDSYIGDAARFSLGKHSD